MRKFDINEYVKELASDKLLDGYNITPSNCNNFANYLDELKNCKNCKGLEYCKNITEGYRTSVKGDASSYTFPLVPCDYQLNKKKQEKRNALVNTLYLPKAILDASFDSFKVTSDREKAYQNALDFIANNGKGKGMYVTGKYSTGKTYFLASIANSLSNRGINVLIIYFPDLVREIKNTIGTKEFEELINRLKMVSVLMLDDLGSEMMSSWLRDEILGPIINYRLSENLPIFISSNLSIEGLAKHLSSTRDGDDEIKSYRIIRRITDMCYTFEFSSNFKSNS